MVRPYTRARVHQYFKHLTSEISFVFFAKRLLPCWRWCCFFSTLLIRANQPFFKGGFSKVKWSQTVHSTSFHLFFFQTLNGLLSDITRPPKKTNILNPPKIGGLGWMFGGCFPFFGSAFFAGFQPLGTQGLATKLSKSILLMATRNPEFTRLILRISPCFI